MIEKQELYCYGCSKYIQFNVDMELNGNHVFECPICGHEHCRIVEDGRITGDRWDSRNPTYTVSSASLTSSSSSTFDTYSMQSSTASSNSFFLYSLWINASSSR